MEDWCGKVLNMAKLRNHSLALTFLRSPSLFRRSCALAIDSGHWWAEEVSWNKILFQFLDFQNHGDSCVSFRQSSDRSDWDSATKTIAGLKGSYCASSRPPMNQPFTTEKYNLLVIKFDAEGYIDESPVSFKLVANVLHSDGSCSQYKCDNGNCVPKQLRCDKYNPCGDNSHCRPEALAVQTIIFIVIGVVAGVIFIGLAVKYLRCKRKSNDEDIDDGNLTPLRQVTSDQTRPANQGRQTATAPEINGDNEDSFKMLADSEMEPPPSYEEVMASQQT